MEPPFRVIARAVLKYLPVSVKTRAWWELSRRPAYLLGVYTAAEQALQEKIHEISVLEFGVAGGEGLLALEQEAIAVEKETGVRIKVYGFDMGRHGLPSFIGDYRDHPDAWRPGDFPMDEEALRARLTGRTTLIIGNVAETVESFFEKFEPPPIGFVSFDLDLFSSTRDALRVFLLQDKKMLWHVPLYFDDIDVIFNHRFAGELLAIDDFNQQNDKVRIDRWHGVKAGRPFPERPFLEKLYVAHDCEAIGKVMLDRTTRTLPL
ncbi:MAG: hypothetical protein OEV08_10580 [Nitrospira sp.]|nr:hypothetical protein [Nitrospira sp.]